jgi:hypothetical protein
MLKTTAGFAVCEYSDSKTRYKQIIYARQPRNGKCRAAASQAVSSVTTARLPSPLFLVAARKAGEDSVSYGAKRRKPKARFRKAGI